MPTQTSAAGKDGAHIPSSKLELRISDPTSLLNDIARRYQSLPRIVMEYVDNGLDAAEAAFRENGGRYPRPLNIDVFVDPESKSIAIRDNARGMTSAELERVVVNVGESQKKKMPWLNGQFGFGVHSFRAAAEAVTIRTKAAGGPHLELTVNRGQHAGIEPPQEVAEPFSSDTGTEVEIADIEDEWFDEFSPEEIKDEIERHFERLLARAGLTITVHEKGMPPLRCQPFDYASVEGEEFVREIDVEHKGESRRIKVLLKVAAYAVAARQARFFSLGRRISEVGNVQSFINKSKYKKALWGNPHLIGYIEVNGAVEPVLTRDEFPMGGKRTRFYEAVLSIEDELKEALDQVIESQRDTTLNKLEEVLEDVLAELARQDKLQFRTESAPGRETGESTEGGAAEGGTEGGPTNDETDGEGGHFGEGDGRDAGPDDDKDGPLSGDGQGGYQADDAPGTSDSSRRRRSGFNIAFMEFPEMPGGRTLRSRHVDSTIYINKAHPDYVERVSTGRQGQARFNDRMAAYLAMVIGIHYKDQLYERYGRQPEARDQLFAEQVEFACRLETAIRPHLAALERMSADEATNDDAQ